MRYAHSQVTLADSFGLTRSFAALGAADLDWIVGPGYSFGVFSMSRFAPPALSSVDAPKTLRDQQGDLSDPHDFFSEFFISFFHIDHIISCPKVLEAY